jgi:hypothetical protein
MANPRLGPNLGNVTEGELEGHPKRDEMSQEWAPACADPRTAPKLAVRHPGFFCARASARKGRQPDPGLPVRGCVDLPMTEPYAGSDGHAPTENRKRIEYHPGNDLRNAVHLRRALIQRT